MADEQSPLITEVRWGRIEVAGLGVFKDAKLWPGGGREWDWIETGTQHVPGTQVADVEELVSHGARTIVLSRGMDLMLQYDPSTPSHLDALGIAVELLETRTAVARYCELVRRGVPVGAVLHSTC